MGLLVEKKHNLKFKDLDNYPTESGEWYYTFNKTKIILVIEHIQGANIVIIIAPHKTHPKIYDRPRTAPYKTTMTLTAHGAKSKTKYISIPAKPAVFILGERKEEYTKANNIVISVSQNGSSIWNPKTILELPIAINEGLEIIKPYLAVDAL